MRPAEGAIALLAAAALAGCGGSGGGGSSGASSPPGTSHSTTSSSAATSTSARTATTPIETSTTGHSPPCPDCGAGLHPGSAATAALTSTDPKVACRLLVTPHYVDGAYGDRSGCLAAVRGGGAARSLRVIDTHPISRGTVVVAIPAGGPSAGERLRIVMVHAPAEVPGGQTPPLWRVDAIYSRAKVGP